MIDNEDEVIVCTSGSALSLLLYENARCQEGYQIGFLLGEVLDYITKVKTDTDREIKQLKRHINIKNVIAYPPVEPFFNSLGDINVQMLNDFLIDKANYVVGWFCYRQQPFPSMKMTARDYALHKNLTIHFSNLNNGRNRILEDIFIVCLSHSSFSNECGTFTFKHVMAMYDTCSRCFKTLQLKINNLGSTANSQESSDYKSTPEFRIKQTDILEKSLRNEKQTLLEKHGMKAMNEIQYIAEGKLSKLIPAISKSDTEIAELEEKISKKRESLFVAKLKLAYQKEIREKAEKDADNGILDVENSSSPELFVDQNSTENLTEQKEPVKQEIPVKQEVAEKQKIDFNSDHNDKKDLSDDDIQVVDEPMDNSYATRNRKVNAQFIPERKFFKTRNTAEYVDRSVKSRSHK